MACLSGWGCHLEQWLFLPVVNRSDLPGTSILFCVCGWHTYLQPWSYFSSWTCAKNIWSPPTPRSQHQHWQVYICSFYSDYLSMRVSESGCFPLVKHTESIPAFPSLAARSIQLLGPSGVYSKKLSASESIYSAFDREMFAAYSSLCHFHFLLKGKDFVLFTVHKPWSAMQQCRLSFLSKFNCDVCHLTGAENLVADALSCPDPTHSLAVPNSPCPSDV